LLLLRVRVFLFLGGLLLRLVLVEERVVGGTKEDGFCCDGMGCVAVAAAGVSNHHCDCVSQGNDHH